MVGRRGTASTSPGTGIAGRPARDRLVDYLGYAPATTSPESVLRLPGQTVSWPDIETTTRAFDSLR